MKHKFSKDYKANPLNYNLSCFSCLDYIIQCNAKAIYVSIKFVIRRHPTSVSLYLKDKSQHLGLNKRIKEYLFP